MINGEKYKNEILEHVCPLDSFALLKGNKIVRCCEASCTECSFNGTGGCDFETKFKWLLSEYKEPIELSKLEYGILEHILKHTEYRYIVRDYMGKIFVHTHEPSKDLVGGFWGVGEGTYENASFLKDLFRFVRWTDDNATSIKDILDNCIVKEN
jgi:hypothetical protein